MKILTKKITDIKPYWKSLRDVSNLSYIMRSIERFGITQPIIIDNNNVIIAGKNVWNAAKRLGLKEIPVIVKDFTEEQAKEYRIIDNATSGIAEWDISKLSIELKGITNISNVFFESAEIKKMDIVINNEFVLKPNVVETEPVYQFYCPYCDVLNKYYEEDL